MENSTQEQLLEGAISALNDYFGGVKEEAGVLDLMGARLQLAASILIGTLKWASDLNHEEAGDIMEHIHTTVLQKIEELQEPEATLN